MRTWIVGLFLAAGLLTTSACSDKPKPTGAPDANAKPKAPPAPPPIPPPPTASPKAQ